MPRFTLRTLFLFLTLIAIALGWVAWQRNTVRQRREFLNTLLQQRVRYLTLTDSKDGTLLGAMAEDGHELRIVLIPSAAAYLAVGREPLGPWSFRRWLGDVTIARIWTIRTTPPEIVELARRLAPEAAIDTGRAADQKP